MNFESIPSHPDPNPETKNAEQAVLDSTECSELLPKIQMKVSAFDYDALPKKDISFVKMCTVRIHKNCRALAKKIVEIGRDLNSIKSTVGHGLWLEWKRKEWPGDESIASAYMRVASKFGNCPNIGNVSVSAQVLLASSTTPDEIREEFSKLLESGKTFRWIDVKKRVDEWKNQQLGSSSAENNQVNQVERCSACGQPIQSRGVSDD